LLPKYGKIYGITKKNAKAYHKLKLLPPVYRCRIIFPKFRAPEIRYAFQAKALFGIEGTMTA
jgi:hypothetical protein